MDLPVYDITLKDWNEGIFATSLVDKPAIESEFIFFNEQKPQPFVFSDEEKMEVIGAILVPDKLIYRKDSAGNEFYVRFTKEVIEELSAKMHKENYNTFFTVQHEMGVNGDAVEFLESWIKETEEDKSVAFGLNEPIGTLFMKVKINSELLWKNIKDGNLNGFSVELDASMIEAELKQNFMNVEKLLKNELALGEDVLRYNALEVGQAVVRMTEEGFEDFSGEFEHEGFKYEVTEGDISLAEEIVVPEPEVTLAQVFEAVQALSAIADKIDNFSTMAEEYFKKEDPEANETEDITTSLEEIKLELKRQKADEKTKEKEKTDPDGDKEFNSDSYEVATKWGRN